MATIGGLGGLGGTPAYGSTFPQRFGTPDSQRVMSNQEFNTDWTNRIDGLKSQLDAARSAQNKAQAGYDSLIKAGFSPESASAYLPMMLANKTTPDGITNVDMNAWANHSSLIGSNPSMLSNAGANVESLQRQYQQALADYPMAQQARGENQTRQQQAYGAMSGWGQTNGVLSPDYAQASFGQVSGQAPTSGPNLYGDGNDWMRELMGADVGTRKPWGPSTDYSGMFGGSNSAGTGMFGSSGGGQIPKWGL